MTVPSSFPSTPHRPRTQPRVRLGRQHRQLPARLEPPSLRANPHGPGLVRRLRGARRHPRAGLGPRRSRRHRGRGVPPPAGPGLRHLRHAGGRCPHQPGPRAGRASPARPSLPGAGLDPGLPGQDRPHPRARGPLRGRVAVRSAGALGGSSAGRRLRGWPAGLLDVTLVQEVEPAVSAAAFLGLAAGLWRRAGARGANGPPESGRDTRSGAMGPPGSER
jgi:hypothetical protein